MRSTGPSSPNTPPRTTPPRREGHKNATVFRSTNLGFPAEVADSDLETLSAMASRRECRKIAPPPLALASRKQVFTRICSKDLHQASRARIAAISAGDWTMDPGRRRLTGHGTTAVPKPAPSGPPCPPVDALQICRPADEARDLGRRHRCSSVAGRTRLSTLFSTRF